MSYARGARKALSVWICARTKGGVGAVLFTRPSQAHNRMQIRSQPPRRSGTAGTRDVLLCALSLPLLCRTVLHNLLRDQHTRRCKRNLPIPLPVSYLAAWCVRAIVHVEFHVVRPPIPHVPLAKPRLRVRLGYRQKILHNTYAIRLILEWQ